MDPHLEQRIQKVLAFVFKSHKDYFEDSYGPDDIGDWDSLNHLNLVLAINNEFKIDLGFEEMLKIKTVGDIKNILKRYKIV